MTYSTLSSSPMEKSHFIQFFPVKYRLATGGLGNIAHVTSYLRHSSPSLISNSLPRFMGQARSLSSKLMSYWVPCLRSCKTAAEREQQQALSEKWAKYLSFSFGSPYSEPIVSRAPSIKILFDQVSLLEAIPSSFYSGSFVDAYIHSGFSSENLNSVRLEHLTSLVRRVILVELLFRINMSVHFCSKTRKLSPRRNKPNLCAEQRLSMTFLTRSLAMQLL